MEFSAKRRFFLIATILYLVCAVFFAAAHFLILRFLVDPNTGLYTEHSIYPTLLACGFAALSLILLVLSFVFRPFFATKEERKNADRTLPTPFDKHTPPTFGTRMVYARDSIPQVFASSFLGFSFLTFSVLMFVELVNDIGGAAHGVLDYLSLAAAFLSGLYFLLQSSGLMPLYSVRRALCSLLPVIWGALCLANCFIKASRSATGEYHEWEVLTIAAVTVFFFLQAQFNLPRREGYRYHWLFAVGLIAAALILLYSFATVLLSSFWIYSPHSPLYALVIDLAVCLYILVSHCSALRTLRSAQEESSLQS